MARKKMPIKVQAKTSHGQVVSVELHENDTIETLKETLYKLTNIPQDSQKILHNGKLLTKITASAIHDGDSMIVLTHRTKPEPPPPDLTPEPDAASIRKAIAASRGVDEKDLEDEDDDEPEFKNQLQDLVNSLFGNFTFTNPAAPAAAPATNVEPPAEAIAQLTDMGFTEAQARRALIINRMSIPQATDWLLEHGDDEQNEPAAAAAPVPAAAGSAGQMVGGGGAVPIAVSRRVDDGGLSAEQRLLEMGFPSDEVTRALRATGNNYDRACAMLLGETDEDDGALDEDSPIVRAIFSNPIVGAGLSNPRVMQAFRAMVENPATVANYISDPEVGPLILQVHAILQGLIPSSAAANSSTP